MGQMLKRYPFLMRGAGWHWLSHRGKWSFHKGFPAGGKNWWFSGAYLLSLCRCSNWAGVSCVLSLLGSAPQGWNGVTLLLSVPLLQCRASSFSIHLKAAQRLLLQLLQAGEGKSFFAWANKTKLSQAKPNCTAPWNAWAGRLQKMPPKKPKAPLPQLHTHPVLGLKDTAAIFGLKWRIMG